MTENENLQTNIGGKAKFVAVLIVQIAVLIYTAVEIGPMSWPWWLWWKYDLVANITMMGGLILFVASAALHIPWLAKRLTFKWKLVNLAVWLLAILVVDIGTGLGREAYYQTPDGKRHKAEMDEILKQTEASSAETDMIVDALEKSNRRQKDLVDQVDDCLSVIGNRLPAFEDAIKTQLHNPAAFEHIETVATAPDYRGHNVKMQFRAENGFGAIRVGTASAEVDTESCEIIDVHFDDE